MNLRLLFVHALSPLHAGTGQGVGVIDLPIAREVSTGLPYLPGSSVKGTLRDAGTGLPNVELLFGPPNNRAEEHAGSVQFADQRLLLLPVRSLRGTFAWVTTPYLLARFAREASETSASTPPAAPDPDHRLGAAHVVNQGCALYDAADAARRIVLEDLDLTADPDPPGSQPGAPDGPVGQWATWIGRCLFPGPDPERGQPPDEAAQERARWRALLRARLCVVHEDVLSFLLDTATEVQARVQLTGSTKTVNNLWYEEALPAETVLAGLVVATPVRDKQGNQLSETAIWSALQPLTSRALQFGGKATVGRGLCRVTLV